MNLTTQRTIVLILSLSLTALLLGALGGAGMVSRTLNEQLRDPKFLNQRLKELDDQDAGPPRGGAPALVRVAMAEEKMAQPQRPIIGRLVEVRRVTVSSEVSGKILKFPVEEGTTVVGDQTVLAVVDDIWCRLALQRCRAQLAATQAQLDFEESELERIQGLRERGAGTESEVEQKQAAVAELSAKLDEITATMEEESEKQQRSEILAPFDGTVVSKHAERGEHVAPGSPIVDIVSRGEIDAQLMVPESIVNLLHVDQTLPVLIDPLGEEVAGRVVSITPLGASASRTFPVRVRLDDQAGQLKVGMSVTAMIATGPQRPGLVVPQDAVLVRPDGSTVWAVTAGKEPQAREVRPVPVTIDVRMEHEYAIVPETAEGRELLVAGTQVVIEGAERLMPGQQVTIVTLNGE